MAKSSNVKKITRENTTNTFVSFSQISEYQRCPFKWYLLYVEGIRPQRTDDALNLGSLVHAGLAFALTFYMSMDYNVSLGDMYSVIADYFNQWKANNRPESQMVIDMDGSWVEDDSRLLSFDEIVDTAAIIVYRTVRFLDIPNNWRVVVGQSLDGKHNKVPYIEVPFELQANGYTFVGKIDAVLLNLRDNRTYLIDWKTRTSFEDDENNVITGEEFNEQMALYHYALSFYGVKVDGEVTYQIASKVPKKPEVLKSGKAMSRANITSDWETYRAAVIEAGFDPNDYLDMQDKLSVTKWWHPVTIYRSEGNLAKRFATLDVWARRMLEDVTCPQVYSRMCKLCPFNHICFAVDNDYDVDALIKEQYVS